MAQHAGSERISSIYFGGGTPSLLSVRQINELLAVIRSLFIVDEAAEITIEANPGTVTGAYLRDIRKLGINRLSLGIQSLNDGELALLGRIHTAAEAMDAVQAARNSGFENLSLDLIYGLPGQTLTSWRETLDKALEMEPEHCSLYALTLEAEAPMRREIAAKHIPDIDPDTCADQYELAEDLLAIHGYRHYEISNWAKEGQECRHNMVYWQNLPYLGIGVAAHSCQNGHRLANTRSLDAYLVAFADNSLPVVDMDEEINPALQYAETVILGLRLCQGISLDDIQRRFGIDLMKHYRQQVGEMVDYGLMEQSDGHIRLTRRGRLLSNEVFWRFLPE